MSTPMVVFTDLDGTLLNHDDYDWSAAKPALAALKQRKVPLVLVSSKTDVEMLELRRALGNTDPLVCENGSLLLIPENLLKALGLSADSRQISDGYHYEYRGLSWEQILALLNELKTDYGFTGFAWMTDEDIAQHTGLTLEAARLPQRHHILWNDGPRLKAIDKVLDEYGLAPNELGKGRNVWYCLGYALAQDLSKDNPEGGLSKTA